MPDGNKDAKSEIDPQVGYGNSPVITAAEYFKRVRQTYVRGCKLSAETWPEVPTEPGHDPTPQA